MQIKVFTIPAFDSEKANDELNRFLRSQRILEIQQEFVAIQNGAYWCYSIKYLQSNNVNSFANKKEKIDYKKVLKPEEFVKFEKLRSYRKEIARNDAVPAYAVFIDAELAEISKLDTLTGESISAIKGIGKKRVEKYGKTLIEMFNKNETNRQSDT